MPPPAATMSPMLVTCPLSLSVNSKWLFVVGLASLKQENLQLLAVMFRFVKHFITHETVW